MARSLRLGLLALALAAFAGSACFGSDDEPTSYVELLQFVPDQAEFRRSILIVDYAALRELPAPDGLPADASKVQQLAARSDSYFGTDAIRPLGLRATPQTERVFENWEFALGLSIEDIDRSLSAQGAAGQSGPGGIAVAVGSFDADAVPALLERCADCLPAERPTHGGITYYDWGEGINGRIRRAPPVYDDLGRGGQFHFTNDYVLRTEYNSALTASLDARSAGSLADRPEFRAIAEALESRGVMIASLSDRAQGPEWLDDVRGGAADSEVLPPVRRTLDAQPRLRPYSAYALGTGIEDGEAFMTIVLAHESTDEATENVTRLIQRLETTSTLEGEPWSSAFLSWEIESDGQLVIATLRGEPRWTITSTQESLILHE